MSGFASRRTSDTRSVVVVFFVFLFFVVVFPVLVIISRTEVVATIRQRREPRPEQREERFMAVPP